VGRWTPSPQIFDEGDYYHHLLETLTSLTELGSAIIVGRGANYVLHNRPSLNVRIIAPLESRINTTQRIPNISIEQAREDIRKSDNERARSSNASHRDWADPLDYHLVIKHRERLY